MDSQIGRLFGSRGAVTNRVHLIETTLDRLAIPRLEECARQVDRHRPEMHLRRFIGAALVAALLLGLVNTLIRPLLLLLTLPVTVLSLGLFIFVINGLMFWLVAQLVDGFHVDSFWSAILGALLYSVISWALSTLLLKDDNG